MAYDRHELVTTAAAGVVTTDSAIDREVVCTLCNVILEAFVYGNK